MKFMQSIFLSGVVRFKMCSIVFATSKAVCLLFASLFVLIAGSNSSSDFITTPKDKEVFVGESVQFDWEYIDSDVREVRFGLVMPPAKNSKEVAIYVKEKNGTLKFNHMDESIKWIRDRVQVVRNRRASFKINAVQLADTRTFFCSLLVGENEISIRDTVELSVVDLLIDNLPSTHSEESWQGRQITVVCAVRLPKGGTTAKFSWMHIPSNTSVARKYHDDTRSKSYLTITTYKDEDFEALQCQAETRNTVKYHVINITRLSSPTPPRNLKAERIFDKQNARPLIRLRWDPPQSNGGAGIQKYIVSYIPNGLSWKQSTDSETEETVFNYLKLPSGNIYNARVRAKNKAGVSPPSNEVEINLEDDPQVGTFSGSGKLLSLETYLLFLSFMVWSL